MPSGSSANLDKDTRRRALRFTEQCLIDGYRKTEIVQFLRESYGVSRQTGYRLINQVESSWAKAGSSVLEGKRRLQSLNKAILRREQLYLLANHQGDVRGALAADESRLKLETFLGFDGEMIPVSEVREFLTSVSAVIQRHVTNPELLNAIVSELSGMAPGGVVPVAGQLTESHTDGSEPEHMGEEPPSA